MNNKKLLGKRIKELRKVQKLTQEQLSEIIGIETVSLSAIESGRHYPSMPTTERIAEALGVPMAMLFDFEHLRNTKELKKDIISSIDKMKDDEISYLYKIVKALKY